MSNRDFACFWFSIAIFSFKIRINCKKSFPSDIPSRSGANESTRRSVSKAGSRTGITSFKVRVLQLDLHKVCKSFPESSMFLGHQQWSCFSKAFNLPLTSRPSTFLTNESKKYGEISRKMVVPFRIF